MGFDCTWRKCPSAPKLADIASDTDTAHSNGVCSDRGHCNHKTGECICNPGYSGVACNHMKCPNNCSGRGRCVDLSTAASENDGYRFTHSTTYTAWDATVIYGCQCDSGSSGYDCSQTVCPAGIDPRTPTSSTSPGLHPSYETVIFTCSCQGTCAGKVKFMYQGQPVKTWLYPTSTVADLVALLHTIPSLSLSTDVYALSGSNSTTLCRPNIDTDTHIYFNQKSIELPSLTFYANYITFGSIYFQVRVNIHVI